MLGQDRAGWVMNADKGQPPSQSPQFLGFVCDLEEMQFKIPEKKLEIILSDIDTILKYKV